MTSPPPVTLTVPCLARYARVVRTVAASCAALEDFSVDRLDDIRLFADECFNAASALGASEMAMVIRPTDGRVVMEVLADTRVPPHERGAALEMVDLLAGVLAADASVVHAEGLSIRATISEVLT